MLDFRPHLLALILIGAIASCKSHSETSWGLPIALGQSSEEVRAALGAPTLFYSAPLRDRIKFFSWEEGYHEAPEISLHWYYSKGITASFDHDQVIRIRLLTQYDSSGWLPYTGTIVEGITLKDSPKIILEKLGPPTKVEREDEKEVASFGRGWSRPLPPEIPPPPPGFVFRAHAPSVQGSSFDVYYWRRESYVIQMDVVTKIETGDDKQDKNRPAAVLDSIEIYK